MESYPRLISSPATAIHRGVPRRFIQKLSNYAPLTSEETAALERSVAFPRKVMQGEHLIREGDRPGSAFVILDGWAIRYKLVPRGSRQITALLMPGDSCPPQVGQLAAMDHSIQAISPARVASVPAHVLEAMMRKHGGIAQAFNLARLVDEGTLRAWIVSVGRRSSIERVAHLMCEIYVRAVAAGLTEGPSFAFPLSQIILADALGMTPVHVNRVLRELRLAEIMQIRHGTLNIFDPMKLAKVAGFDENYLHRRRRKPAPGRSYA